MKKILFLGLLLSSKMFFSQMLWTREAINHQNWGATNSEQGKVSINNQSPRATLDIDVSEGHKNGDTHTNEGILIPRLTKERVYAISKDQLKMGTLVYVIGNEFIKVRNQLYSSPLDKYNDEPSVVSNIDSEGFYYFNGDVWDKISTPQNAIKSIYSNYTITNADIGKNPNRRF